MLFTENVTPTQRLQDDEPASRVLIYIERQVVKSTETRLLYTQSIGNKFTLLRDCITSIELTFFGAVETWHDSDSCPNLVACPASGYGCNEKERRRSAKNDLNIKSNRGSVFLFNKINYAIRLLQMPSFNSFELLAVHIEGGSLNLF